MSPPLPRYQSGTERKDDALKLTRILAKANDHTTTISHGTAGGDNQRLRGIPAIGRGVTGAIKGTAP